MKNMINEIRKAFGNKTFIISGNVATSDAVSEITEWGADAIYDIVDGKLEFGSYFKMPAPQLDQENCVAHNGSIVPVPGRDIFVQAWYQGGISVVDFTDTANPVEIAYFDRGPIDAEDLVLGGYWSSYWYNGRIYATGIIRAYDVSEPGANGTFGKLLREFDTKAGPNAIVGMTVGPDLRLYVVDRGGRRVIRIDP